MIPFEFAATTMKSIGLAVMKMVIEIQSQFDEKLHLLDPMERPDYDACIAISTKASLKEMVPPGSMVIFTPLLTGIFFGVTAVSGLLVGSLVVSENWPYPCPTPVELGTMPRSTSKSSRLTRNSRAKDRTSTRPPLLEIPSATRSRTRLDLPEHCHEAYGMAVLSLVLLIRSTLSTMNQIS